MQMLRIQILKFVFFLISLKFKNKRYPTQTAQIPLSLYKVFFFSITMYFVIVKNVCEKDCTSFRYRSCLQNSYNIVSPCSVVCLYNTVHTRIYLRLVVVDLHCSYLDIAII